MSIASPDSSDVEPGHFGHGNVQPGNVELERTSAARLERRWRVMAPLAPAPVVDIVIPAPGQMSLDGCCRPS